MKKYFILILLLISFLFTPIVEATSPYHVDNDGNIYGKSLTLSGPTIIKITNPAYGGVGDGNTDNTAAWNAAVAALPSAGGAIYFPRGKYYFASTIYYTTPTATSSITILGDGPNTTELTWASGINGIHLVMNGGATGVFCAFHIRDLALTTASVNQGIALYLEQTAGTIYDTFGNAQCDITNVTIRGNDLATETKYWQYGILNQVMSNINVTNVRIDGLAAQMGGIGVYSIGTSTAGAGSMNFFGCRFGSLDPAIKIGNYSGNFKVVGCDFGCIRGIFADSGLSGLSGLQVSSSNFDAKYGIETLSYINYVTITNNTFVVGEVDNGEYGIYFNPVGRFTITGNIFLRSSSHTGLWGISVVAGGYGTIMGNIFEEFNTTSSGGIWLQSGSYYVNVQSNTYINMTTQQDVLNQGSYNTIGGGSI